MYPSRKTDLFFSRISCPSSPEFSRRVWVGAWAAPLPVCSRPSSSRLSQGSTRPRRFRAGEACVMRSRSGSVSQLRAHCSTGTHHAHNMPEACFSNVFCMPKEKNRLFQTVFLKISSQNGRSSSAVTCSMPLCGSTCAGASCMVSCPLGLRNSTSVAVTSRLPLAFPL